MTPKYILALASGEAGIINKTGHQLNGYSQQDNDPRDILLGVEIKYGSIDPALHNELSAVEFSHVVILDITANEQEDDFANDLRKEINHLLPFLLSPAYWKHLSEKILFLKTQYPDGKLSALVKEGLRAYALHNVKVIPAYAPVPARNGDPDGLAGGQYLEAGDGQWRFFKTDPAHIREDAARLAENMETYRNSNKSILEEFRYARLLAENRQLKDTVAILSQNIFELNNYYRYVRGEVHFKHHNREEDNQSQGGKRQSFANLVPSATWGKGQYQAYYNALYESLPGLYKKFATVLKIVLGRKELRYYLNKKHKQAFLDLIGLLSEEKQVQIWYYYEYEILPKWYKKFGRLLQKR
jgi:hypothetical protein